MPCDSSYMEATPHEILMSRLLLVLDELRGGKTIDPNSNEWRGYDPRIYNGGWGSGQRPDRQKLEDEVIAEAGTNSSLVSYSLEVQTMVRDLKALRRIETQDEIEEQRKKDLRAQALGKLTDDEKEALGIKDYY